MSTEAESDEQRFARVSTIFNSTTTSLGQQCSLSLGILIRQRTIVVYTDDYNSDPLPSADALRNRALVIKLNKLFRP